MKPDSSSLLAQNSPAETSQGHSRRTFLRRATVLAGATAVGMPALLRGADPKTIQGFEKAVVDPNAAQNWKPVSDRKIRFGLVGHGVCQFGAAFGFQDHPNVQVVAVSDLFPDRCAAMAKACRCPKTYPSLEEMIKDDSIEAVFVATDAPSHARHCAEVLRHGKHVASAVPAIFRSLEEGEQLLAAVKKSGRQYMMFETSAFHEDLTAMRRIYQAGALGKVLHAEGEYYHYMETPIDSYKGWRVGLPPQFYPTHSNAYYNCVTGGTLTEVSCLGIPSRADQFQAGNNPYRNVFGTEVAFFRTSEGGTARMAVSWDTPGNGGEMGRVRGRRGSFNIKYEGLEKTLPDTRRPALPPGLAPGSHGGSHGPLTDEFVTAILQNRRPLVDITTALNLTAAGIVAHQSALKNGEWLKIPQFQV